MVQSSKNVSDITRYQTIFNFSKILLLKTALTFGLWMLENKLKLNSGKTGIIVFSSSYRPRPTLNNLGITSDTVECSTIAKNIGVIFRISLSMVPHVTAICIKVIFFHLRNILKIRMFLSDDTCRNLIYAFVTQLRGVTRGGPGVPVTLPW